MSNSHLRIIVHLCFLCAMLGQAFVCWVLYCNL